MTTSGQQTPLYVSPEVKIVEIKTRTIICQSLSGDQNESYGTGDTSGWY